MDQSTGIREALEAEVSLLHMVCCNSKAEWSRLLLVLETSAADCKTWLLLQAQTLAEQAIDAREKAEKGRQKAAEAERDVEAALVVKQKLEADIDKLRQISSEPSAEQGSGERLRPDQTVDLGTSTQGVPTDEQNLDAELKGKLEQLHEVQKTIDEVENKVRPHLFLTKDAYAFNLFVQAPTNALVLLKIKADCNDFCHSLLLHVWLWQLGLPHVADATCNGIDVPQRHSHCRFAKVWMQGLRHRRPEKPCLQPSTTNVYMYAVAGSILV